MRSHWNEARLIIFPFNCIGNNFRFRIAQFLTLTYITEAAELRSGQINERSFQSD